MMKTSAFKRSPGPPWFLGIALVSCLACSSSDDRPPFNPPSSDGGRGSGGRASGGSGGATDPGDGATDPRDALADRGGNGGASAPDAMPVDGGHADAAPEGYTCPSDFADAAVPIPTSLCSISGKWGPGVAVPVEVSGYDELVAITADELTIVKRTLSSIVTYWIAERTSKDLSFDAPRDLAVPSVVALSHDGLRLMTLSAGGSVFQELTRADRSSEFGSPTEGAFVALNADAAARSLVFNAAVVSPDDRTLYYTASKGTSDDHPIYVSTRAGSEPWPVGSSIEQCELQVHDSLVPLPTGVSADGLTLFFFDNARGIARAAFAEARGGPFLRFADLGVLLNAQPNAVCDRLYYSTGSVTSPIVAAPAE